MTEEVYRELCKTMAKRGGMYYPGMDIPEFYAFQLEERPGIPVPPVDRKALKAAIKESQTQA